MTDNKRYYAFDSLRASMMFLGVVIHSAMNYSSFEDLTWPIRAKETSVVFFYLVHFSIALFLSGFINDLDLSVYVKFLIVLFCTTFICLVSYHFLVRRTFIGVFLNGKKT